MFKKILLISCLLTFSVSAYGQSNQLGGSPSYSLKGISNSRSALDSAEIILAYIAAVKYNNPDEYYKLDNSLGVMVGLITKKFFGIGITYLKNTLADKVDDSINFRNLYQGLDIYVKMPIPNIIELIVGVGILTNDLECDNKACANLYGNLQTSKSKSLAYHSFVIGGLWFGKIYNLQAGIQMFNAPSINIQSDYLAETVSLDQSISALSIGVGVLF